MFPELTPPHDDLTEQAVLGAVLLENSALEKLENITSEYFYQPRNSMIFSAMRQLARQNTAIDLIALKAHLAEKGILEEVGGLTYISQLMDSTPTAANVLYHAEILRGFYSKRKIRTACMDILGSLEGDISGNTDRMKQALIELAEIDKGHNAEIVTLAQVAQETIDYCNARSKSRDDISGITTGFAELDRMTDGWQETELYIIGARPGMGKTALGLEFLKRADVPCAALELEMGSRQIGLRMLAGESDVRLSSLRKGYLGRDEWDRLRDSLPVLSGKKIFFDFCSQRISEIIKSANLMIAKYGIKILLLDYLQLATPDGKTGRSREAEVAEISRALKHLAMKNKIAVIALAQLNRGVELRENKRPLLSDLRESGQLEQDADAVMFLYSEAYYKKNDNPMLEVIISKGRNIETGVVTLHWDRARMKFDNFYTEEVKI